METLRGVCCVGPRDSVPNVWAQDTDVTSRASRDSGPLTPSGI